jgi:hypothetical protein
MEAIKMYRYKVIKNGNIEERVLYHEYPLDDTSDVTRNYLIDMCEERNESYVIGSIHWIDEEANNAFIDSVENDIRSFNE